MEKQTKLQYKVVGKTIVAVINKKKLTYTAEKDDKELVRHLIEDYNKRNSKEKLAKILSRFNKKAEDKKLVVKAKKKLVKKELKQLQQSVSVSKKADLDVIDGLKKENLELKDKLSKLQSTPKVEPSPSPQPRGGEH